MPIKTVLIPFLRIYSLQAARSTAFSRVHREQTAYDMQLVAGPARALCGEFGRSWTPTISVIVSASRRLFRTRRFFPQCGDGSCCYLHINTNHEIPQDGSIQVIIWIQRESRFLICPVRRCKTINTPIQASMHPAHPRYSSVEWPAIRPSRALLDGRMAT